MSDSFVAQDQDVTVLRTHPGEGFPDRVRRGTGSAEGEPLIPIPPPGRRGAESLCPGRLAAAGACGGSPDVAASWSPIVRQPNAGVP
jgi:hypothetical protein